MARHVEIDIDSDANTKGFIETAVAADRAASRLDKLGDEMRGTAKDAALLDAKILATKSTIRSLGQQYAISGDKELAGTLANQRGKLANLEQIRVEMDRFAKTARDVGDISAVRNIPVVSRVVDDMRGAELAAADLDRQIVRVRESVLTLGEAFSRTGSKDVLRSLRDQRSTLAALEQIRKDMRGLEEATDKAADKAEKLGDNLRSTAAKGHTLEEQLVASKKAVVALGEEFTRTGDKDVFKNLRDERVVLSNLQRIKKELAELSQTDKKGDGFGDLGNVSGVLSSIVGKIPPQALIPIVSGLTTAIAGALTAALLIGLSGVVLAGGILAAIRSQSVRSAWQEFGHGALEGFASAGLVLEEPMIKAAQTWRQAFADFLPDLRRDFEVLAPIIGKIAEGVAGFVKGLQPGLFAGLQGAVPVMERLGEVLPQVGADIGEFFAKLGDSGPAAADALEVSLRTMGEALVSIGGFLSIASEIFDLFGGKVLLAAGHAGVLRDVMFRLMPPGIGDIFKALGSNASDAANSTGDLKTGLNKVQQAEYESAQAQATFSTALATGKQMMQEARQAAADLEHQLSALATQILNGKSADLAFKQGRLDMIDALKASKGSLDESTAAGISAEQSMLRQAQNAVAVRDSMLQQKLGVEAADKAYDGLIQQIYNDAAANGVSKEKVDALIGSLRDIPRPNPIDIKLNQIGMSPDDIREFKRSLLGFQGTYTATVNTIRNTYYNNITRTWSERLPGPYAGGNRWGGLYEHAALGKLREASVYSAINPGRYMIAEPQTGGEAFVPRRGNRGRSMSILARAAGWYGATLMPDAPTSGYASPVGPSTGGGAGMGGAGRGGGVVELRAAPGDQVAEFLLSLLRPTVRGYYGGDVTVAMGGVR